VGFGEGIHRASKGSQTKEGRLAWCCKGTDADPGSGIRRSGVRRNGVRHAERDRAAEPGHRLGGAQDPFPTSTQRDALPLAKTSRASTIEEYEDVTRRFERFAHSTRSRSLSSCPNVKKAESRSATIQRCRQKVVEVGRAPPKKPSSPKLYCRTRPDIGENARQAIEAGKNGILGHQNIMGNGGWTWLREARDRKHPRAGSRGRRFKRSRAQCSVYGTSRRREEAQRDVIGQGRHHERQNDALEFIIAGASAVGSAVVLYDPMVAAEESTPGSRNTARANGIGERHAARRSMTPGR